MRDCTWRIHASVLRDKVSWAINKLEGEHATCGRLEENPIVSSAWLCRQLLQDLKANLDVPVDSLRRLYGKVQDPCEVEPMGLLT